MIEDLVQPRHLLIILFLLALILVVGVSVVVLVVRVLVPGERRQGSRKCPFCAELIRREAVVCRFCGRDVPVSQ